MKRLIVTASAVICAWGLATQVNARRPAEQENSNAGTAQRRVIAIADEFVAETFAHFPVRYPASGRYGELGDNSIAALRQWQQKEDGWIEALRTIDPDLLEGTPARVIYGTMRERLEARRDRRVCRDELWRMSAADHWLTAMPTLLARQPVGSAELRRLALARFGMLARHIDTEIANLRQGLKEGFSTPKIIVQRNIRQLDAILSMPSETSPFFDPDRRASTPEFVTEWRALVTGQMVPAVIRYRNFLRDQYLAAARDSISISEHPNSAACFRALVRDYTSLRESPEALYDTYLQRLEDDTKFAAREIAGAAGGSADVRKKEQEIVAQPGARFNSRDEVIPAVVALIDRFDAELPKVFSSTPKQRIVVQPTPDLQEETGSFGFYAGGGIMRINMAHAMAPAGKLRLEGVVFHEAGHHVQATLTRRGEIHRALLMLRQPVFNEGWGDYVAQLAYERGLFSENAAAAFRHASAQRLASDVVHLGVHVKGWSRAQAIDFLSRRVARTPDEITRVVDRMTANPGELLAYSAGRIKILELRDRAKQALGPGFDLREFHDRVLEHGSVTLPMLTETIERWIAAKRMGP